MDDRYNISVYSNTREILVKVSPRKSEDANEHQTKLPGAAREL